MDAKKTGELIAGLRKEKGLSQIDFAGQLNISNRTVSKWENGDGFPDVTLLPEIANYFGITTDELLSGELNAAQDKAAPAFICEFTETKNDLKNASKVIYRKRLPISYIIILGIANVFLFTMSNLYNIDFANKISWALLIVYISCIILYFLLPLLNAGVHMKNRLSIADQTSFEKHMEFSDKIYIFAGNGDCASYAYSKITDVIETKDLFVINFANRMFYYSRKDSFIVGRPEDFLDFIMPKITPGKNISKKKILKLSLISALVVLMIISVPLIAIQLSNIKIQYGYKDIGTKIQYFTDNEKEFEKGLQNVSADKYIAEEVERYQYTSYYADDYITLSNISDVDIMPDAVAFTVPSSDYYSGYVKYSGKADIPYPGEIGFAAENIDKQNFNYVSEDDLYLLGREENNINSLSPWFMIKEIGDDWYYYEYHSIDELSTP